MNDSRMMLQGRDYLGLSFDDVSIEGMLCELAANAPRAPFRYVVTPNVDHLVRLSSRDPNDEAWKAYREADWCICDSRVLSKLSRPLGIRLSVVPGSDLTEQLFETVLAPGDRICLIGGDERMLKKLHQKYPKLDIQQHIPPMGMIGNPAAMDEAVRFIVEAKARFTLLAVGSPQQELIAHRVARVDGAVGIGLCIGASIRFITGDLHRAPHWMREASLEWLYRLIKEPRRLWRRYLLSGPRIFVIMWRWAQTHDY